MGELDRLNERGRLQPPTDGEWMTPSGAESYQGPADAQRARITARARMIAP